MVAFILFWPLYLNLIVAGVSRSVNFLEKLYFYESFNDGDPFASKWIRSTLNPYTDQSLLIKPRNRPPPGFEKDMGMQLGADMQSYAVAVPLPESVDFQQARVVIQYELKLQDGISCSGAYIKLLGRDFISDLASLDRETPYK
jgi:calnexin